MMKMSLTLNSMILTPVTIKLFTSKEDQSDTVIGPDTQGRRILTSIYHAINMVSLAALAMEPRKAALVAAPLFATQIIYKTTTAFYNMEWNAVIYANQFVTAMHLCALYCMKQDGMLDPFLNKK